MRLKYNPQAETPKLIINTNVGEFRPGDVVAIWCDYHKREALKLIENGGGDFAETAETPNARCCTPAASERSGGHGRSPAGRM